MSYAQKYIMWGCALRNCIDSSLIKRSSWFLIENVKKNCCIFSSQELPKISRNWHFWKLKYTVYKLFLWDNHKRLYILLVKKIIHRNCPAIFFLLDSLWKIYTIILLDIILKVIFADIEKDQNLPNSVCVCVCSCVSVRALLTFR